jgi:1-acyl-sn-glycerol-3-phosphate acyltransferase
LGEVLYATWWWSMMALGILTCWLAVMGLPRLAWRWEALRRIARIILAAIGSPVTAVGVGRVPRGDAILVFNHASYVDALVLAALLPGEPAFVAKSELSRSFLIGSFLRRLGVLFVERYDMAASLADAEIAIAAARRGRVLVFFPEGAFTRRAGLSDFYLGAFKAAAEANLPVYPGVLRGTRSMLRADQWFPRRSSISVEIADPIVPSGTDFPSVLRLRDAARNAMLARCGEPDLSELVKPAPQGASP